MSRNLLLFASLLATPAMTHPEQHVTSTLSYNKDPRFLRLKAYFSKRESPVEDLTADFIAAADRHSLDWRLLPAISVAESSGGKRYKNNNIFGWASCEVRFPSVREGIHIVAERLSESDLYRDKSTDEILRTYNPSSVYPRRIRRIMKAMGPETLQRAVSLN